MVTLRPLHSAPPVIVALKCVVKTNVKYPEGVFALTAISGGTFFCRGGVLENVRRTTQLADSTTDKLTLFLGGETMDGWRSWGKQWIIDLKALRKENVAEELGKIISHSLVIVFL